MTACVMLEAAGPTMTSAPSASRRLTASLAISGFVAESAVVRVTSPPAALMSSTASAMASREGPARGASGPVSGTSEPIWSGTTTGSGSAWARASGSGSAAATGSDVGTGSTAGVGSGAGWTGGPSVSRFTSSRARSFGSVVCPATPTSAGVTRGSVQRVTPARVRLPALPDADLPEPGEVLALRDDAPDGARPRTGVTRGVGTQLLDRGLGENAPGMPFAAHAADPVHGQLGLHGERPPRRGGVVVGDGRQPVHAVVNARGLALPLLCRGLTAGGPQHAPDCPDGHENLGSGHRPTGTLRMLR